MKTLLLLTAAVAFCYTASNETGEDATVIDRKEAPYRVVSERSKRNFALSKHVCPCGWKNIGNKCYKFFAKSATWVVARSSCQKNGGDLVIISSLIESRLLASEAKKRRLFAPWIGYFRPGYQSRQFLSVCGVRPAYENWAPGQPNNAKSKQNCAHLYAGGVKVGKWNDRRCSDLLHYICEFNYVRCNSFQKLPLSSSCKELLARDRSLSNGVYKLQGENSKEFEAYCHMTKIPGCGHGGWTLVMKMDGSKTTFKYDSSYWTNKKTYALNDGLKGLPEKQTKLASYWNTPFNKICLGMKVNGVTKWIVIDHKANSLFNVIARGDFTASNLGKKTWKSLVDGSSLQSHCNNEGFNLKCSSYYTRVRIGFVANNEANCNSCDSYVGFGAYYNGCGGLSKITCGNFANCHDISHYSTNTKISAFGYILVQ